MGIDSSSGKGKANGSTAQPPASPTTKCGRGRRSSSHSCLTWRTHQERHTKSVRKSFPLRATDPVLSHQTVHACERLALYLDVAARRVLDGAELGSGRTGRHLGA